MSSFESAHDAVDDDGDKVEDCAEAEGGESHSKQVVAAADQGENSVGMGVSREASLGERSLTVAALYASESTPSPKRKGDRRKRMPKMANLCAPAPRPKIIY